MFFSSEDVFSIRRKKPAGGIDLRKSKLVRQLNFLERAIAQKLVQRKMGQLVAEWGWEVAGQIQISLVSLIVALLVFGLRTSEFSK